ncbi:MAG: hypothetical protein HQL71_07325 [Magnetococcales bacterium]|nr:hypothetical protein [Magnetococcales bacterium]
MTNEDIASKLCLNCLLCCKGVLCRVILTPDELHYFSNVDLALRKQSDKRYYFTKRCPQLKPDGCAIYTKRLPDDCSRYHCRTLKPLLDNKINLTTALQRVELVKKQLAVVFSGMGIVDPEQANFRDLIKNRQYEQKPELLEKIRELLTNFNKFFHSQEKLLAKLPEKPKSAGVKIMLSGAKKKITQQQINKREVEEVILNGPDLNTPAYIVDEISLQDHVATARDLAQQTDARLLYSMKANSVVPVLKTIAPLVDGMSCSSLLEILLGRKVSGEEGKLHFVAPGIGVKEATAITNECSSISFNSVAQWNRYQGLLDSGISCGLRVNPHKSLVSRPHYDPCRTFSKLGISVNHIQEIWQENPERFKNIEGLHVHNAVGNVDFKNLQATVKIIEEKIPDLLHNLQWINIGGGYRLGTSKNRPLFFETCNNLKDKYGLQVYIEPGTAMVKKACWLLSTVVDIVISDGRTVAILDSSINHQLESYIYNFKVSVYGSTREGKYSYLLAGATCLAGDLFGEYSFTKPLSIGSKILFKSVGAYTQAFWIQYNGLNIPSIYSLKADNQIILNRDFTLDDFIWRCGG